jgi:hypothetical protein
LAAIPAVPEDIVEQPDWAAIFAGEFVYEPNCWKTCNSYCCSGTHEFGAVPRQQGATIFFMEAEYHWLKAHRTVPKDNAGREAARVMSFDFGGPRPLRLLKVQCHHLGLCAPHFPKPLFCRLYPLLPIIDLDGNLEDAVPASLYDLTMAVRNEISPCTLMRKREAIIGNLMEPRWLDLLKHPLIVFHLQAAKCFADLYVEGLRNAPDLLALEGKRFWQAWEVRLLSNRLVDMKRLAHALKQRHDAIVERCGALPFTGSETALSVA